MTGVGVCGSCGTRQPQQGAAIVTVLLIVALATTVVSSLFWRQHVAVRSVENRLAMAQTRWIERGAIDYARLVLAEDHRRSNVDWLGEPWATPVQDTRLDETITGARVDDRSRTPALLAGQIFDAQARLNLNNIVVGGTIDADELEAFRRLLALLGRSPALADQLLARLQRAQPLLAGLAGGTGDAAGGASGAGASSGAQQAGAGVAGAGGQAVAQATALRMKRLADLLEVPGFDADTVQAIEPFAIFLPNWSGQTTVNLNTAPAEVIAARLTQFDGGVEAALAAARAFVVRREAKRYFRDPAEASTAMQLPNQSALAPRAWSVASQYFLLRGMVRFERVVSRTDTLLLARPGTQNVEVEWQDRY